MLVERILSLVRQLPILFSVGHVSCHSRSRGKRHDCTSTAGSVAHTRAVS